MSAGHSASTQVRRPAPAAPARATQAPSVRATQQFAFSASGAEDELRLNLNDIPVMRMRDNMHVEGFKPSILSRLLNLIMPLDR
jgi:hypothetical protein